MADAETARVKRHLPGDRRPDTRAMIRVDQAGEHGAARIYAGQLAVMGGRHRDAGEIRHMAAQEQRHLDGMNRIMAQRGVRPTLLGPFWHVAGFALGAATALLGHRGAMACTVAVEEAIDEHYRAQEDILGDDEAELRADIARFRAEELEHRDTGLEHEAEQAPAYRLLSAAIKTGCKIAIKVSERV